MAQKVSILGDSISTFAGYAPCGFMVYYEGDICETTGVCTAQDTWWMQVINALGGEFLANASYSGSLVEGPKFPAGCSNERIEALSRDGVAPDVVVVFMGINDYGWGGYTTRVAAKGDVFDPTVPDNPACPGFVASTANDDALERFERAYELMLKRICTMYPQAEVWCCTLCPGRVTGKAASTFAYQLRGINLNAYNDAIRKAAKCNDCQVADVWAQGFDYDAYDGTHPTALGMQQLAAMIVQAMGQDVSSSSSLSLPDEVFRSHETCTKPNCIGCADALSTGNAWMLVCRR